MIATFTFYKKFEEKLFAKDKPQNLVDQTESIIPSTITALGRIQPKNEIMRLSGPSALNNARIAQLLVDEGERVKKNQVIAIVDSFDKQQAVLNLAQKRVEIAQAQLNQTKTGDSKQAAIVAQQEEIDYLKAELKGQVAIQEAIISRLKIELAKQAQLQQAQLDNLSAQLAYNELECQRYENLFLDGGISESTRDAKCLEVKTLTERLKETQTNKNRTAETLQEQIREALATLNQIQTTLTLQIAIAQANLAQLKEVRPVDVQVAQAELDRAIAAVKEAQADLDLTYIKAPVDGQVIKIHTYPGESIRSDGILELAQTEEMHVIAEIYESDIPQIKIGQKASISSTNIPLDFRGSIAQIGSQVGKKDVLSNDPNLDLDARIFEVKIILDKQYIAEAANYLNLQVEVNININSR